MTPSSIDETNRDTTAWVTQTWISFALASGTTLFGIYYLPVDVWQRAFLAMGLVFTMGSCFSLAKTTRDRHESERLINRVRDAKAEQILRDMEVG